MTLASASARAQTDAKAIAEALFQEGRRLVAEQKLAEACPKFAESQRLDPSAGTQLNLANCLELSGKLATAWATYREAAVSAQTAGRADLQATALKRAEALTGRLSRITILAPDAPRGLVLAADGAELQSAVVGVPIPFDVGTHIVTAKAPGKEMWSKSVTVEGEGKQQIVTVPPLADAAAASPPSASATSLTAEPPAPSAPVGMSTQRIVGLGAIGLGAVGLGVGTYFTVQAKSRLDDSYAACDPNDRNRCTARGVSLRDDARRAGNIATVTFGISAAALVTGVVLYVRGGTAEPTKASRAPSIAPFFSASGSGASLAGTF
jgi:hypothetical protein